MRVPVRAGGSGRGMIWWCVHACACEGRRKGERGMCYGEGCMVWECYTAACMCL